ncbi:hypothetical protein VTH06DRAFT_5594 [Thermothelomyces fergusii]
MGNEYSKPEQLEGRSRSLSPLPRDEQLLPDDADDLPPLPSTMPASFRVADGEGPGPPGAPGLPGLPGSPAWRRQQRRVPGFSPELPRASPPLPGLLDGEPPDGDPKIPLTARAVSIEDLLPPSTEPTGIESANAEQSPEKKKKKKKKAKLKEGSEAAHDEAVGAEPATQDHERRRHRSTEPSPPHSQDGKLAEVTSPPSQSQKQTRIKGLDSGGTPGAGEEEEEGATTVNGHSIFDLEGDADAPSSTLPRGKRPRRDSDAKPRKKRKSSQFSDVGLDDGLEAVRSEEPIDRLAPEVTSADVRLDLDGGIGREEETATPKVERLSSPSLDERMPAGDDALRRPSTPLDHGSQRSDSESGHAEAEVEETPPRETERDALERRGSPELGGDDVFAAGDQANRNEDNDDDNNNNNDDDGDDDDNNNHDDGGDDDDDEMSVASDSRGSPVATPAPTSPADAKAGNGELNGDAVESAPSEHGSDTAMTPSQSVARYSGGRSSARRKAKVPFFARGQEENAHATAEPSRDGAASQQESGPRSRAGSPVLGEDGPSEAARTPKPKKKKRRPDAAEAAVAADRSDALAQPKTSQYRTGALSKTEEDQIARAMERFRENEGLTQQELNRVIHDNPQKSGGPIHHKLWATIQDACPTRPRKKLIAWCRQRYNNWAGRGTWTPEQDDELVDLVAKHGKKWSYIAGLINRYQKDVRDRWRNYLVCRDTVRTDAWSEGEEERFRDVVEKAIEKIREGVGKETTKPAEALINWFDISKAMGYTRSRLQCMEKWKRMRAAEPRPDAVPTVLPPTNSWRLQKAREDLRKITARDKYRLMCAIRDSGAASDAKISWLPIVKDTFQSRFERQALVVTWGRLRRAVPDWETKTPLDAARYLCEMYENEGHFGASDLAEASQAEDDAAGPARARRRRNGKRAARSTPPDEDRASSPETSTTGSQRDEDEIVPSTIREDRDSAARNVLPKRGGAKGKKTAADASPERTRVGGDRDVETEEESTPAEPRTDRSSGKRPRQADKEPSPGSDSWHAEASPSIEARAARFRRRPERTGSAADRGSAQGKGRDFRLLGSATKTASKPRKKQRRASLSDGEDIESPKPKKRKVAGSLSKADRVDRTAPTARSREDGAPESRGKPRSDISSDMDDMEDIPATLPASSQAARGPPS